MVKAMLLHGKSIAIAQDKNIDNMIKTLKKLNIPKYPESAKVGMWMYTNQETMPFVEYMSETEESLCLNYSKLYTENEETTEGEGFEEIFPDYMPVFFDRIDELEDVKKYIFNHRHKLRECIHKALSSLSSCINEIGGHGVSLFVDEYSKLDGNEIDIDKVMSIFPDKRHILVVNEKYILYRIVKKGGFVVHAGGERTFISLKNVVSVNLLDNCITIKTTNGKFLINRNDDEPLFKVLKSIYINS